MKKMLSISAALLFCVMLLLYPQRASAAVREALVLCGNSVIPSLFPFFTATGLLVQLDLTSLLQKYFAPLMGPLFHLRGICAAPVLAGLLGGYPAGARTAAQLYREETLSRQEGALLLGFCNNCGPAFIIGYVGNGILSSSRDGWLLYLIHTVSALISGCILCRIGRLKEAPRLPCHLPRQSPLFAVAFTSSVSAAMGSCLQICAYVVLFRVVIALLPVAAPPWVIGGLEMVTGLASLQPGREGFITAAGILGWGGLCVHCQTMAVAEDLPLGRHWLGKGLQCALSVVLAALLYP